MSSKLDKYLKDFEKPKTDVEHNPQFDKATPPLKINEDINTSSAKLDKDVEKSETKPLNNLDEKSKEDATPIKDSLSKYKISTELSQEKDSPEHDLER